MLVGSQADHVEAMSLDLATGQLSRLGTAARNPRPTAILRHPLLPVVYIVDDSGHDGSAQGGIQAYRIDSRAGALDLLSDVRAGGSGTNALWLDTRSNTLLAANFGSGSLSTFALGKDGAIGAMTSLTRFSGSGPHRRQATSHAHAVSVDPSGKWVLVTDLGADRVWVAPFDRAMHRVLAYDPVDDGHFRPEPGSGPRHMAWHPSGRFLYVLEELTARIDVLAWDARAGRLERVQSVAIFDPANAGTRSASEIIASPDGRFVYAADRQAGQIVVYAANPANGTLRPLQRVASGGSFPWNFVIDPSGRWLLVANRDSNSIAVLARNPSSGLLTETGQNIASELPVHIAPLGPAPRLQPRASR
jgi:6-phosphogluconolactonase